MSPNSSFPLWLSGVLNFPILRDPGMQVALAFGVRSLPTTVLLDEFGIVQSVEVGPHLIAGDSYLRQEIERRLTGQVSLLQFQPNRVRIGTIFPDFLAETIGGRPYRRVDLHGKWTLMVMSMSGCPSCGGIEETLYSVARAFRRRGGAVLWANINPQKPAAAETGNGLHVYDPLGSFHRLLFWLPVPRIYLLDPKEIVRSILTAPFNERQLNEMATVIQHAKNSILFDRPLINGNDHERR